MCCPAQEGDWDASLTDWWAFPRIKNILDEYPHALKNHAVATSADKCLFFADYIGWSMAWAVACGDENHGRIAVIDGGSDRFVADSFGDFVDLFLKDPKELL